MKKVIFIVAVMVVMSFAVVAIGAEKAPDSVVQFAKSEIVKIGADPAIIKGVKAANAKGQTLDQIKSTDKKWKSTAGIADYMQAIMDNPCGKRLQAIRDSKPFYAELFAMDNQGANACMSDKTSDYWQGDEAKFKESYKGGAGAVHIGGVKFDDSTQTYLVQVSIPVKDGGKVIGAITIGVDIDAFESSR